VAIYDATSQGTPAVIFQWDDEQRNKSYADTFPLLIAVDYNQINIGPSVIILDPVQWDGSDQHLVIDATAPNHIHIRAGGEIDQSTAELILGGENTYVKVSDISGNVDINAADVTISSQSAPSALNINTFTGAIVNSARTSGYAPEDKIVATLGDIAAGRFGASASYHSRVTQGPQASANLVQPFTFSTTDWETGIERVDNTKIKMLSAGKYNIAFSAQLVQANNAGTVNIWLNKNGTPMAYTNTKVVVESNATYTVAAWNFFVDAAANDYYELIWSSSSTHTTVQYDPAQTINGNLHPEIPSIIVTVNQVG
jgi:hypothetical protein